MARRKPIRSIVVVSDLHVGCKVALAPKRITLDEGGYYERSPLQDKIYGVWRDFWRRHVPLATEGEPFVLVLNGDVVDGEHHRTTTTWSNNIKDQRRAAEELLRPILELPQCSGYYHIRGTEVHVGQSAEYEEEVASDLGAIPDDKGNHARNELWIEVGQYLGHFLHHVGTTSRVAYETTAVMAELAEAYTHSAQWNERAPDFIIRSHRHRYIEIRVPSARGYGIAAVTPAWQGKTPFVWKIAGARQSIPQFGGLVIRVKKDELYTRPYVKTPGRDRVEEVTLA